MLPLSNQLLILSFKRKWPQPSLRAQPALGHCARSWTASSVGSSQASWLRVSVWMRVQSSLWGCRVSWAGRGCVDSNGRWLECTGITGSGGKAEGEPFLAIFLDLIFSKCWDVNATCHYENCWIFCHETTIEFDSHHIPQLVEQIYPSFLNVSLGEWDFTCD